MEEANQEVEHLQKAVHAISRACDLLSEAAGHCESATEYKLRSRLTSVIVGTVERLRDAVAQRRDELSRGEERPRRAGRRW